MSGRQVIFLQGGIIVLLLFTIGVGGYFLKTANDAVDETKQLILEGRQIANLRGNQTLGAVGQAIIEIRTVENEIRDNLTEHRIVTNETRDSLNELIAGFNNTNEVERAKAVNQIIDAVNNNTKLLEEFLGVNSSGGISSVH